MRESKSYYIYFAFIFVLLHTFGQTLGAIATPFNCSEIEVGGIRFNIKELDHTLNITKTVSSPLVNKNATYLINPCSPLTFDDKENEEAKCHDGTLICEIITYWNNKTSLITSIQSVATINDTNDKEPVVDLGPKANANDLHGPLLLTLYGEKVDDEQQKANITFICDPKEESGNTTIISYKENTLEIRWVTKHVCGEKISEPSKGLGGFTKFLIFIFVVIALYLVIGAGYNYHVYRSQGWDLLPNRDFWRDVPYMASDLSKNLFNTIRGSGHSGYSRV